jgi:hypothetical protein
MEAICCKGFGIPSYMLAKPYVRAKPYRANPVLANPSRANPEGCKSEAFASNLAVANPEGLHTITGCKTFGVQNRRFCKHVSGYTKRVERIDLLYLYTFCIYRVALRQDVMCIKCVTYFLQFACHSLFLHINGFKE